MIGMKFLIGFLLIVLSLNNEVMSQRSPYAGGRPTGYKDRFRPEITTNNRFGAEDNEPIITGSQRPPMQGVPIVNAETNFIPLSTQSVANRIGVDSNSVVPTASAPTTSSSSSSSSSSSTTNRLPYDAHGDQQLVDHLNSLPYDKRPFWFINAQAIEAHRNSNNQNNFAQVASRSSFLG